MDKYTKPGMEKNNNALLLGVLIGVLVIIITLGNCRDSRILFIIYLSQESYVYYTNLLQSLCMQSLNMS
jgi:hypothetical protein